MVEGLIILSNEMKTYFKTWNSKYEFLNYLKPPKWYSKYEELESHIIKWFAHTNLPIFAAACSVPCERDPLHWLLISLVHVD